MHGIENFKHYCRKNSINIVKEEYSQKVNIFIELTNKKYEEMKRKIDNLELKMIKISKIEEKYV